MSKLKKKIPIFLLSLVMLFVTLLPCTAEAAINHATEATAKPSGKTAVKLSAPNTLFVDIGGTAQINLKTKPETDLATLGVTFVTSNAAIVTVDGTGLVSGIGKGSATVAVKYGKKSMKVNVLVSEINVPYVADPTFTMAYPQSWSIMEDTLGTNVAFITPREDSNDLFMENINMVVVDIQDAPITLTDLTKINIAQVKESFTNTKILSSKKTTWGGQAAHEITCIYKFNGFSLKALQLWTIANNRVYIFSYGAEINSFDRYTIEVLKMRQSFRALS